MTASPLNGTPFDGHAPANSDMRFPPRLRIVAPGGALMLISGLAAAWIGFPILFTSPREFEPFVAGVAVFIFAPLLFAVGGIASWVTGGGSPAPAYVIALALVAVSGYPVHAIVDRPWAVRVTTVGLVAWILCQVFMILAFRSI